ncbi:MAG: hypothetical protein PVG27_13255 [Chloroflexota bacterium]|jgi:predicted permease
MGGERLARVSLVLDGVYCLIVGSLLVALRVHAGGLLRVPALVVAAAGVATVGWAVTLFGQGARIDWRTGIKQVLTANALAAVALAVAAALHPVRGARILLGFVSLDVVAFAVAQGISLIRGRSPR